MIFDETTEGYMSSVEAFLGEVYDVVVDYDPMGMDEYWIDDKVVTINDMKNMILSTNRPRPQSCPTFGGSQSATRMYGNTPL